MKKIILILLAAGGILAAGEHFTERAFYLSTNMAVPSAPERIEKLAERAEKAGYNTVYFGDYKFGCPWLQGERYAANVKKAAASLRRHHLKVVAMAAPIGDCCSFLMESPELAECLKVVDEPYTVVNGVFTPVNMVRNGSFEQGFETWRPDPDVDIAIDSDCAAVGKKSLRFRVTGSEPGRQIRTWLKLKCRPFQQYLLSFKVKTRDMKGPAPSFGISAAMVGQASDQPDGFRYLSHRSPTVFQKKPLKSTQDWQEYRFFFNTFEFPEIDIALGCWGGKSGVFWLDDVQVKPASFMNVLRRSGMGVKVVSADRKTVYAEGKDYEKIVDPKAGNYRWKGDWGTSHEPPRIRVLPGSRIRENEQVLASYYHAALSQKQACICLNTPRLKEFLTRQIDWLQKTVNPDGFLIGIDEQRAYGYDPECEKSGLSSGEALNRIARFTYSEIKRLAPGAKIYMWNDMFDPFGNCRKERYFYMVKGRGSLWNSWNGLPRDIIILRWTPTNLRDREAVEGSMKHWRDMGMKYIQFPGYFEGPVFNPRARAILELVKTDPACIGAAFAQWKGLPGFTSHFEKLMETLREVEGKTPAVPRPEGKKR